MNENHEFRIEEKHAVAVMATHLTKDEIVIDALINSIAGEGTSNLIDFICFMGTFVYDKTTGEPVNLSAFVHMLIEPDTDALLMEYSHEFQERIKNLESSLLALAIMMFVERLMR